MVSEWDKRVQASITLDPFVPNPSPNLATTSETMAQSKRWCYTLNNYSAVEKELMEKIECVYQVIGIEKGENGTPHLQGFIIFKSNKRLSNMKTINKRAHWEPAKGTSEQASTYCKKDGNFKEFGRLPMTSSQVAQKGGDAEKKRWDDAKEMARNGNIDDVPSDIFIKYYRTLKEIRKDYMTKPDDADDVTGVWIHGPPGVGKSRKAREEFPGAYLKMQNKWWDGYQNEEFVILDDFDCKELGHLLKIWADRYSFLAETKGGAIHIRPKKFIITSNYGPHQFGWDEEMYTAIKRRFKIIEMPAMFVPINQLHNP